MKRPKTTPVAAGPDRVKALSEEITPATSIPPAIHQSGDTPSAAHLRVFLDRAQREHDLLLARTNIFLVYNSLLMAGFAIGTKAQAVLGLLPPLGLVTSVIWIYTG